MADLPGYMSGGFQCKYCVTKVDNSAVDPEAHYFVLRFDKDPHARVAMRAYAESVMDVNPDFWRDITKLLKATASGFRQRMIEQYGQRPEAAADESVEIRSQEEQPGV